MSESEGPGELLGGDGRVLVPRDDWDSETRAYQASKLRHAGYDWRETAEMAGYPSTTAAKLSVRSYLQKAALTMETEQRQEALALEVDRLESLIKTYWLPATHGDLKAAEFVLKVIGQESRLLDLEAVASKQGDTGSKTIIISGGVAHEGEGPYVEALRAIAEQATIPVANRNALDNAGKDQAIQVARVGETED